MILFQKQVLWNRIQTNLEKPVKPGNTALFLQTQGKFEFQRIKENSDTFFLATNFQFSNGLLNKVSVNNIMYFKDAGIIFVEEDTQVKKCFRLKGKLDLKIIWNFQPKWICFGSIILKISNQLFLTCIPKQIYAAIWNLQRKKKFFRTA